MPKELYIDYFSFRPPVLRNLVLTGQLAVLFLSLPSVVCVCLFWFWCRSRTVWGFPSFTCLHTPGVITDLFLMPSLWPLRKGAAALEYSLDRCLTKLVRPKYKPSLELVFPLTCERGTYSCTFLFWSLAVIFTSFQSSHFISKVVSYYFVTLLVRTAF